MRWAALISLCVLCVAASPPRYAIKVGRSLTFNMLSEEKGEAVNDSATGSWRVTVVRKNADGSFRLVFRIATTTSQMLEGRQITAPETIVMNYADLFADGRPAAPITPDQHFDPTALFPRLPDSPAEIQSGWTAENPARLETTHFTAHELDRKDWSFSSEQVGLLATIYSLTERTTYHFDMDKGIVTKIESDTGQTFGAHLTGREQTELSADTIVTPAAADALERDVESLRAASDAYNKEVERAMHLTPEAAAVIMDQARASLGNAAATASDDDVRNEFRQMLGEHEQTASFVTDEASHETVLLNKPAFAFSLKDLNDRQVNLTDFRGKVVVLVFWYRGNGWCLYALPQTEQIAADFAGRPVALLGMNTDSDGKDAHFVADAMQLPYPTLRGPAMPENFGVRGFPTFVLIDQQGMIRRIHPGYSPTLRRDIGEEIGALIAK